MRRERRGIPRRVTAFRGRLLIPVLATLGVTGALAIASGTHPATHGQAAAALLRPNVLVMETDDQTLASISRHNAPAYASVKAQLAARLHDLQDCAGSSCRVRP
jgi:hypothetical protein